MSQLKSFNHHTNNMSWWITSPSHVLQLIVVKKYAEVFSETFSISF